MFRELMRKKKRMSERDCVTVLKHETRGVLSVNGDDGYPYGMPMNHYYREEDGRIYFHCGRAAGHRLDALTRDSKVSFCVCDQGYRKEGQWALNVRSVIVFGRIRIVDDPERIADITARLSRKFTQDEEYIQNEIRAYAPATLLLELTVEHMCGKLVEES